MPAAEAEVEVSTLTDIYMTSGLTTDDDGTFRGFVTIFAQGSSGDILRGQGTPEEIRTMALRWLEVAEAAEQDCIVMTMLTRDLGIPSKHAAGFITAMRAERDGPGDVTEIPGEDIETKVEKEHDRDERPARHEADDREGAAEEVRRQDRPADPAQDRGDAGDLAPGEVAQEEPGGEG